MSGTGDGVLDEILSSGGLTVSRLGLRFDRVAQRVLGTLSDHARACVPPDRTVLLALAAPLRQPGRLAEGLKAVIAESAAAEAPPDSGPEDVSVPWIEGPAGRLQVLTGVPPQVPRLIATVHTDLAVADALFSAAAHWIRRQA